jgi:hypothetical protein
MTAASDHLIDGCPIASTMIPLQDRVALYDLAGEGAPHASCCRGKRLLDGGRDHQIVNRGGTPRRSPAVGGRDFLPHHRQPTQEADFPKSGCGLSLLYSSIQGSEEKP